MKKKIKLCYIGGGSKMWARVFMSDLALSPYLEGEIALYDIDIPSAEKNARIGERINQNPNTISRFEYKVYEHIEDALRGCDVVVASILPGTFDDMESDVHMPEEYGIYQSVGDTVGPGGVLRAMRTVPSYIYFATKIKECSPNAWVINLTNPMSICVKTLYDVFPEIKAFGCCHEVFHTQDFLKDIVNYTLKENITRKDIECDLTGINHFTWISSAKYKGHDVLKMIPSFFVDHKEGYYEHGPWNQYLSDPFAYANKVKYEAYLRYGILPAAGDRHLAEFFNNKWYLGSKQLVTDYGFALTTVAFRKKQQKERIEETRLMAEGKKEITVAKSQEEVVQLIEALLGFGEIRSNVNLPNMGQVPDLPLGYIVETNCVFSHDKITPIKASPLPLDVLNLVYRNINNIETCYEGIKSKNFKKIFASFMNQPLCSTLDIVQGKELFRKMVSATKSNLVDYYDFDNFDI